MRIVLDKKDLAKYPFLKESQHLVRDLADDLQTFLSGNTGRVVVKGAAECIWRSCNPKNQKDDSGDDLPPVKAIAVYAVARILVSCVGERALIDRFVTWQSWQFYQHIIIEAWETKVVIAERLGIDITTPHIPVQTYVESIIRLREEKWRLVNRYVSDGLVMVAREEVDELLRERLWTGIRNQLPLAVPQPICALLSPVLDQIKDRYQQTILQEFGSIEESAYPPCIRALLNALASGAHITHIGRFTATAFLHNIGMKNETIIELYGRAPDFNIEKTMYQVDHISGIGGGGTEYTAPGCSTLKTHSLCVHPDSLCKSVNHPLSYYKQKKKSIKKRKQSPPDTD